MSFRSSLVLLLMAIFLLLQGCGQTPIRATPKADHGYVVVSYRNNDPGISWAWAFEEYPYYDTIDIQPTNSGSADETYTLHRWGGGIGGDAIYTGTVPTGSYRLVTGHASVSSTNLTHRVEVPILPALGEFDVYDNRITDLGLITSTLAILEGEMLSLHARIPTDRDLGLYVRRALEEREEVLPEPGEVGWLEPPLNEYNTASIEYARLKANWTSAGELDAAGRLVVGTALGDLSVRGPDGEWTRVPTGVQGRVYDVESSPEGLYLSTAFGRVLHTENLYGDAWAELPRFSEHSDVVDITRVNGRLYATVIEREIGATSYRTRATGKLREEFYPDSTLVLYQLEPDRGEWTRVDDFALPIRSRFLSTFQVGGDLVVHSMTEMPVRGALHHVDFDGGEIRKVIEGDTIGDWRLGSYDGRSFVTYWRKNPIYAVTSPFGTNIRLYRRTVDLRTISDGNKIDSTEQERLDEIYHIQMPVVAPDDRIIAFGNRSIESESGGDIYQRLEGAMRDEDGKEVPYDVTEGTYFLSDPEEGWVPFAIPPEPCGWRLGMMVAENRLIQRCRFGPNYSVTIGESEWQEEGAAQTIEGIGDQ